VSEHHTLILNQFPPRKRKSLLRWLNETPRARRGLHQSFVAAMTATPPTPPAEAPDQKTRITYSILSEFGSRLRPAVAVALVNAVDVHLLEQSIELYLTSGSSSG
jgi:hypothetical protein